ncbi:MAG: FG-GAP-like repeat-containing protein, partial [Acidimicrobiia bacterium]
FTLANSPVRAIAAGDFDGDGNDDVAVATPGIDPDEADVYILTGDGAGNLANALAIDTGRDATGIVGADLDGDGDTDLATSNNNANPTPDTVAFLENVQADVELVAKMDEPDSVFAGEPVEYTIELTNNGPDTATGVMLVDDLPDPSLIEEVDPELIEVTVNNVSVVADCSIPGEGEDNEGHLVCELDDLEDGDTVVVTFSVIPTAAAGIAGEIVNLATVIANEADTADNNSDTATTTVVPSADLSVEKLCTTTPAPVLPGSFASCSISVTNDGPSAAASVQIQDTLALPIAGTASATAPWSCPAPVGGVLTCTRTGDMPAGTVDEPVVTYVVQIPEGADAGADFTNTVTVSSTTHDPDDTPPANSDSATISVVDCTVPLGGFGARYHGTSAPEVICGTPGDDRIYANGGNDVVFGRGGDDRIYAGNDNDFVSAGSGEDRVYGGSGNDLMFGLDGEDRLYGDAGNDVANGGNQFDRCYSVVVSVSCENVS